VAPNELHNDEPHDMPSRRLSSIEATRAAKEYFTELTGKECERISGLSRTENGWSVVLEVVELERIPQTTDLMASYCVNLDLSGELLGYDRIRRYCRCQPDEAKAE
jgi:hypothetical protein